MRRRSRIAALVLLQVLDGVAREHLPSSSKAHLKKNEARFLSSFTARLAALETLKLIINAALFFYQKRRSGWQESSESAVPQDGEEFEVLPLNLANGFAGADAGASYAHERNDGHNASTSNLNSTRTRSNRLRLRTARSTACVSLVALLFVARAYFTHSVAGLTFVDPLRVYLSSVIVPLFSAIFTLLVFARPIAGQQWAGKLLQFSGLLSIESPSIQSQSSWQTTFILYTLAFYAASIFVALEHVYKSHSIATPYSLNSELFLSSLILQLVVFAFVSIFSPSFEDDGLSVLSLYGFLPLLLSAVTDIASINVIFHCDAVALGVSSLLSVTALSFFNRAQTGQLSAIDVSGTIVAGLGFFIYIRDKYPPHAGALPNNPMETKQRELASPSRQRTLAAYLVVAVSFFALVISSLGAGVYQHALVPTDIILGGFAFTDPLFLPPPFSPTVECARDPLSSLKYFDGERKYHHFDDVLLIVFFSHARYDVNLDYYKEVYSEYFPNMVFVGPRNREDKGFAQSYDVLVDSYQSDEDISDMMNYKMAGRMAHHMLHAALTTPPYSSDCYKGYLWAPFDTLLNVPRLQQFDQDRLWYFSPWGQYVPNPAADPEMWQNATFHAPPARVSRDPVEILKEEYKGWWVDWWWGDPHFGIPVCMPAFERVAPALRERMASRFLDGETRFIGGSADTLYVPQRLKAEFLDVLSTFLATDCFLEIAVPTTVHLIVPEGEEILFVDHWWIWEPPLNATFVRRIWDEGMEVDTFHTFHWGDKDENGIWKANHANIDDVRQLLAESAERQGTFLSDDQ